MEIERPTYYAIIPAEVRYDEELSPYAKLLYGEFTCLSSKEGYCFASNSYFAELYKVTPQAISKWVKSLERKNYIRIKYMYDGKEIKERRIFINMAMVSTPVEGGINTGLRGYQPTIKGNNTRVNNTRVNRVQRSPKEKSESQKLKELYEENYSELYKDGYLQSEKPILNWGAAIGNLNKAISNYGYENIEKAIKASKDDNFCVERGYSLQTILSAGVLAGLINGTGKKIQKTYGTSLCARNGTDTITKEELENAPF